MSRTEYPFQVISGQKQEYTNVIQLPVATVLEQYNREVSIAVNEPDQSRYEQAMSIAFRNADLSCYREEDFETFLRMRSVTDKALRTPLAEGNWDVILFPTISERPPRRIRKRA